MISDTIRCARERAYLYGADAVILEKEANRLIGGPLPGLIDDCSEDQLRALLLAQEAKHARRRYFRELEAINRLMGHDTAHFEGLV